MKSFDFLKTGKFWIGFAVACLIVFLAWDPLYLVWREDPNLAFDTNIYGGWQIDDIAGEPLSTINLNDKDDPGMTNEENIPARYERVKNECYPKCRDDESCVGFEWRIESPDYSNCQLRSDPWKPHKYDIEPSTHGGMWARRTEWDKHGDEYVI